MSLSVTKMRSEQESVKGKKVSKMIWSKYLWNSMMADSKTNVEFTTKCEIN